MFSRSEATKQMGPGLKTCPLRDSSGFTLLEVLVAVAVLAVGLVAVMEGLGRTQQALRVSENLVTASLIAENKLTEIEMKAVRDEKPVFMTERGRETRPGRVFDWEQEAGPYSDSSLDPQAENRLSLARVRIKWQETRQRQNELKLETLVLAPEKKVAA